MPVLASRSLHTESTLITFDAATLAWVAAVITNGGSVSDSRKTIVNTLIVTLKANGTWVKRDRLWVHAAENQPSALTDLVALQLATEVASPTFTTDRGYNSNIGGYINTGYLPNAGGNVFLQDSGHLMTWQITAGITSGGLLGSRSNANDSFVEIDAAGNATDIVPRINNVGSVISGLSDLVGLLHANRSASNATQFYQNGGSIGSNADASVSPVSENALVVGGLNGSGGFFAPCAGQFALASVGSSLTATEAANDYSAFRTYMTAVGVP